MATLTATDRVHSIYTVLLICIVVSICLFTCLCPPFKYDYQNKETKQTKQTNIGMAAVFERVKRALPAEYTRPSSPPVKGVIIALVAFAFALADVGVTVLVTVVVAVVMAVSVVVVGVVAVAVGLAVVAVVGLRLRGKFSLMVGGRVGC